MIGLGCSSGAQDDTPPPDGGRTAADAAQDESGPTTGVLGDDLTNEDATVTVSSFESDVDSDNQFDQPEGVYVAIDVTIKAHDDYFVSSGSWQFSATDGTTVTAESYVAGVSGMLEIQTIHSGQKAHGLVVFDVDPDMLKGDVTITHSDRMLGTLSWVYTIE